MCWCAVKKLLTQSPATLRKNFETDLHEIFREGKQWPIEQMVKFWWWSGSWIWILIVTLLRRTLAEVCIVAVLLVNIWLQVGCSCTTIKPTWVRRIASGIAGGPREWKQAEGEYGILSLNTRVVPCTRQRQDTRYLYNAHATVFSSDFPSKPDSLQFLTAVCWMNGRASDV